MAEYCFRYHRGIQDTIHDFIECKNNYNNGPLNLARSPTYPVTIREVVRGKLTGIDIKPLDPIGKCDQLDLLLYIKLPERNEAIIELGGTFRFCPGSNEIVITFEPIPFWYFLSLNFWEYVENNLRKLQGERAVIDTPVNGDTTALAGGNEAGLNGNDATLPKKPKTLNKWRETYSIVLKVREDYSTLYENDDTDDPTPRMEDYIEALKAEGKKYGKKQLRKIINAGDADNLKN